MAILCGGPLSHLGSDKGLYCPVGTESLVCRAIKLLGPNFPEVLVVVKHQDQVELYERLVRATLPQELSSKLKIVFDAMVPGCESESPLSGVVAAVELASQPMVSVVAVGQVGVRASHLRTLLSHVGPTAKAHEMSPAAFFHSRKDQTLGLPSVWPRTSLLRLKELAASGLYSVAQALGELGAIQYDVGQAAADLSINGSSEEELENFLCSVPARTSRSSPRRLDS